MWQAQTFREQHAEHVQHAGRLLAAVKFDRPDWYGLLSTVAVWVAQYGDLPAAAPVVESVTAAVLAELASPAIRFAELVRLAVARCGGSTGNVANAIRRAVESGALIKLERGLYVRAGEGAP